MNVSKIVSICNSIVHLLHCALPRINISKYYTSIIIFLAICLLYGVNTRIKVFKQILFGNKISQ